MFYSCESVKINDKKLLFYTNTKSEKSKTLYWYCRDKDTQEILSGPTRLKRDIMEQTIKSINNGEIPWYIDIPRKRQKNPYRTRDTYRRKVYSAEKQFLEIAGKIKINEIKLFIDMILEENWFKERFPKTKKISVKFRKMGRTSAYAWHDNIVFDNSYDSVKLGIVLHELAHVITDSKCAGHGIEFRRNFVLLAQNVVSDEKAKLLREDLYKIDMKYPCESNAKLCIPLVKFS